MKSTFSFFEQSERTIVCVSCTNTGRGRRDSTDPRFPVPGERCEICGAKTPPRAAARDAGGPVDVSEEALWNAAMMDGRHTATNRLPPPPFTWASLTTASGGDHRERGLTEQAILRGYWCGVLDSAMDASLGQAFEAGQIWRTDRCSDVYDLASASQSGTFLTRVQPVRVEGSTLWPERGSAPGALWNWAVVWTIDMLRRSELGRAVPGSAAGQCGDRIEAMEAAVRAGNTKPMSRSIPPR